MTIGAAIIIKNKKILLVKRSGYTTTYPHVWACPGGRGNKGETPEQVTIREIKEELSIDFKPTKLFSIGQHKTRKTYRYLGEFTGEIIPNKEEITEYNFFTYKEAKKLEFGFDYKDIIEKLHKEGLI